MMNWIEVTMKYSTSSALKTKFNPLTHGYFFPNRFEFKGFDKFKKYLHRHIIYGMCGGMVFTALDYYFDQINIPQYAKVNEIPLNYTKYLWKRQSDSVSISTFFKIIWLASLSKTNSIRRSINVELPLILERLEDGLPAPIVVIRASLFQNPTHNHQVLVNESTTNKDVLELSLYDPNHPKNNPKIIISTGENPTIEQSSGEPIRGFFVNKYKYKNSQNLKK